MLDGKAFARAHGENRGQKIWAGDIDIVRDDNAPIFDKPRPILIGI